MSVAIHVKIYEKIRKYNCFQSFFLSVFLVRMPQNATNMVATARTPWKADAPEAAPSLDLKRLSMKNNQQQFSNLSEKWENMKKNTCKDLKAEPVAWGQPGHRGHLHRQEAHWSSEQRCQWGRGGWGGRGRWRGRRRRESKPEARKGVFSNISLRAQQQRHSKGGVCSHQKMFLASPDALEVIVVSPLLPYSLTQR